MNDFIKALKQNSKQSVFELNSDQEKDKYSVMEESLNRSLKGLGFDSWRNVTIDDLDQVFVHFVDELKLGKLKVEELALGCEYFYRVVPDWNIIANKTKYGQHFLRIADSYYNGYKNKQDKKSLDQLLEYILTANYDYWDKKQARFKKEKRIIEVNKKIAKKNR